MQKITLEVVLFGIGLTALVCLLMHALFEYSPKKDWAFVKRAPLFIKYLGILVIEIIKASLGMIRVILDKNVKVDPVLVTFHSGLKTKMGNFILANSITLTPGTITVSLEGDKFVVHCLDRSMLDISADSTFIKNIKRLEEGK